MRRLPVLALVLALVAPRALAGGVEPPPDDAYRVEAASIPSAVGALGATIYRPAGEGEHPALVLVPGATAHGRHHALYVALGRYLAARGWIVVSFDLRGHADSTVDLAFDRPEDFDFAADLLAAMRFARALDGVADGRVLLVGHSRGAGLALAALARGLEVERLVAISPPRRIPALLAAPDEAIAEHGAKLAAVMDREPFAPELTLALVPTWAVERVLELESHPPLLFIDGELEEASEKGYLETIYARLSPPKQYARIDGAGHYFGVDWWRDGVSAPLYHDAAVVSELADVIDRFLRGEPVRPEESSG